MDIWYQCIYGIVSPLSLQNIFCKNLNNPLVAKRTNYGRTLGHPVDSWVAFGDRATVFQQHWICIKFCIEMYRMPDICQARDIMMLYTLLKLKFQPHIEGILPKGPYPPCLRMAARALLTGYPRYPRVQWVNFKSIIKTEWYIINNKSRFMCSINWAVDCH